MHVYNRELQFKESSICIQMFQFQVFLSQNITNARVAIFSQSSVFCLQQWSALTVTEIFLSRSILWF